jgi:hypothetical protein
MFRKLFDKQKTEVNSKGREYFSKHIEVAQSASRVVSNAGLLKKPKVGFKGSQKVASEPKFCLSENERSTVEVPVEKTGATVDTPVVFGETKTAMNEGSLILRRSKVDNKETEISFREADIPQKAMEAPLLFKEVGKRTNEGSIIFIQTKIVSNETKVLFEGNSSEPGGITEAAVPFTERHRTTMDPPIPYGETEGVTTDAPVLILGEEGNRVDASAPLSDPKEPLRNIPAVFIDTKRATMDSPPPVSKNEKPTPAEVFPTGGVARSRLVSAYRKATDAFQQLSTLFLRAATVNKPLLIFHTRDGAVAQVSPCSQTDTCCEASHRPHSPATSRVCQPRSSATPSLALSAPAVYYELL